MLNKVAASAHTVLADLQDHPVNPDHWDQKEFPEIQEDQERPDAKAIQDNLVYPERVVNRERLESLDYLDAKVFVEQRERQERKESQVHKDREGLLDILDVMGREEAMVRSDRLDLPDKLVCQENVGNRELLDHRDNLDLMVLTANAQNELLGLTNTRSHQFLLSHRGMNLQYKHRDQPTKHPRKPRAAPIANGNGFS
ncbi:hypothetical protein NECAME_17906, partial [Necator americanus]